MEHLELKNQIEQIWQTSASGIGKEAEIWIHQVIEALDSGSIRCAVSEQDHWQVHEWVKKAILLYFKIAQMETIEAPPYEYRDKIPLKRLKGLDEVRVVPPATCRYGAFLGKRVILMPSYVNIGAYIDEGTMVDTWATVGSCAQIGKNVHLSGGVGIGGVLEPLQASPVIIEDGAFIGSRCVVVEGVRIGKEAVLGANVVITGSTKIIDVSGSTPVEHHAFIPERSVVIPGTIPKTFSAGVFHVPCALIIGKRKQSTDLKTSLNEVLRTYEMAT